MKYRFEAAAKACVPMPGGLTLPEQAVYQSIAALATRYRCGTITAADSITEKKMIDAAYENQLAREAYIDWCACLHLHIEQAMNAYRLNRTLENADRLVDTIDGLYRGNIE